MTLANYLRILAIKALRRWDAGERKTALIARELARYNIDIAAISETHLSDTGELCEQLGGYTYYWSGRPASERAGSGVGFAIRNGLVRDLSELPKGVNDRLMTLRIPIASNKFAHLISVYAPTLPSADEDKETFYQQLKQTLENIPACDKIVLLGDFNARVGTEYDIWDGALGKHGVGKCNDNGLRLLSLCAQFNLSITNTYFRLAEKYKTSWMHPRSKHWHLLDYIIVRQKDLRDVLVTRAMRGAVGWTDHRLIRSKMYLQLKAPRRAPNKIPPKLTFSKLITSPDLGKALDLKFAASAPDAEFNDIDGEWRAYAKHLHGCAQEIVGKPKRRIQDWFDESDKEIRTLVEQHRHQLNSKQTETLSNSNASQRLKGKVREFKNKWWSEKAAEMQHYADTHQTGRFFEGIRTIFGPRARKIAPMYTKDRQHRVTSKADVIMRWAEHFNDILNPDALRADLSYISNLQDLPVCQQLEDPPSFEEFVVAVKRLKNLKTPGLDQLPSEVYKYSGKNIIRRLFHLVSRVWETEEVPQDWKDACW
ncbi:hypothetical protein B5X24_HaOG215363 [Helicoverpa armigera]|nr:hypothetical protein B5X24_HaOG215363 [Helicoverpa armigera]